MTKRRSSGGTLAFWLGWFIALNVLWLGFISAFDLAETVAGLAASALAATAATAVRRTRFVTFRPRARWLLDAWRLPGAAVVDCVVVFGALWRRVVRGQPLRGSFHTQPFRLASDASRQEARRALFTIGASIPPNTYVVGIDQEEHAVLLHQLVPRRGRR